MGSVTIIFLAPIFLILMIFSSIFNALTGDDVTKVELPYDEAKGIVWEYDGVDDFLFDLEEIEVKGDKQVFTFRGKKNSDVPDEVETYYPMEVIFTDNNGDKLVYYAIADSDMSLSYRIKMYSPDEYITIEYSVSAETVVDTGVWRWDSSVYDMYHEISETKDGKMSFKIIEFTGEDRSSWSRTEEFVYYQPNEDYYRRKDLEKMIIKFEYRDGKAVAVKENRGYFVNGEWDFSK